MSPEIGSKNPKRLAALGRNTKVVQKRHGKGPAHNGENILWWQTGETDKARQGTTGQDVSAKLHLKAYLSLAIGNGHFWEKGGSVYTPLPLEVAFGSRISRKGVRGKETCTFVGFVGERSNVVIILAETKGHYSVVSRPLNTKRMTFAWNTPGQCKRTASSLSNVGFSHGNTKTSRSSSCNHSGDPNLWENGC